MEDAIKTTYPTRCPHCGCGEMFVRKDFPQRVGMGIVVVAGAVFLVLAAWRRTMYLGVWVLVAASVVDAGLYWVVPKVTTCYRCRRDFRGAPINPEHGGFELATAEKYRGEREVSGYFFTAEDAKERRGDTNEK